MRRVVFTFAMFAMLWGARSSAQDQFEIQVYDSDTAAPGEIGLETHINHVFQGSKGPSVDGTLPTNRSSRLTLEPHLGVLAWAEVGFYLQTAMRPTGTLDFAGVKLRFKARYPKKWRRIGLAANVEISSLPKIYEANQYASEVRLIADAQWGPVYVSVNPIFSIDLKGAQSGIPQLQPAAKISLSQNPVSFGFEYYGGQSHTLYAVADYAGAYVDLNIGLGYGFAGDNRWIVKAILGFHGKR